MGIPDHLTYLLRNLYAGQEATVRAGYGTTDCFQFGKGLHQGCILSPCIFNLYSEYIIRNAGLDEPQTGFKIAGRNIKKLFFPVLLYGCESWTIKKAEHLRIDAFELWCWRSLLRVPWSARRSNQSIIKEISPEYSLQGLMLKLQYFDHLLQITDSLEKTLMLGKIVGRWRNGRQLVEWHHQLDGHEFEQAPGIGDWQGSLEYCSPWGCKGSDTTEWLNWTALIACFAVQKLLSLIRSHLVIFIFIPLL